MIASPPPSEPIAFEEAIAQLERILRNLEDGTTTLEDGLAQYERGVGLLKLCYSQLQNAEQRIVKLAGVDEDGKPTIQPFDHAASVEISRPADSSSRRSTLPGRPKPGEGGSSY